MGLKSEPPRTYQQSKEFAPYMGLKSDTINKIKSGWQFAPYMGLKSLLNYL